MAGNPDVFVVKSAPTGDHLFSKRFGGIDSRITMAYLLQSDFNKTIENGLRVDANRIRFLNCTTPSRPAQ